MRDGTARGMLRRRHVPAELSLFDLLADLGSYRPRVEPDSSRIPAAVSLICVRDPDALLLIRRAVRDGDPWSGQLGLPGGRKSPADADLLSTAIRETFEEVGIELPPSRLITALDDLAPTTAALPRITVRPFVFLLEDRPVLFPNLEVASTWWVTLEALVAPGVYGAYEIAARDLVMSRPGYRLPEGVLCGMTERILTPFLQVLQRPVS
jgi:8-oxo-dGTP pyrophosphatase MutT (NUDIX family)